MGSVSVAVNGNSAVMHTSFKALAVSMGEAVYPFLTSLLRFHGSFSIETDLPSWKFSSDVARVKKKKMFTATAAPAHVLNVSNTTRNKVTTLCRNQENCLLQRKHYHAVSPFQIPRYFRGMFHAKFDYLLFVSYSLTKFRAQSASQPNIRPAHSRACISRAPPVAAAPYNRRVQ